MNFLHAERDGLSEVIEYLGPVQLELAVFGKGWCPHTQFDEPENGWAMALGLYRWSYIHRVDLCVHILKRIYFGLS